jgi:type II secretory pathway pseudopilin PulG
MKAENRSQKPEARSQKLEQQRSSLPPTSRLLSPVSCLLNSSPAAFTLIEIMVVIVIIMILVGIVIHGAKYAQIKTATSRAQSELALMETALEHYKNDNGVYPTTPPGRPVNGNGPNYANSYRLYTALAGGPGNLKTYFTFKANQIQPVNGDITKTNIVDPFGHLYSYYYTQPLQNDQLNSATFDLWSYGPSGTNGDANMITNWKQ